MIVQHVKNHFEKHRKTHAVLLTLAVLASGVYLYYSKGNVHAEGETVPVAPTLVSATPGDSSVTVEWRANGDGGSPIMSFLIEDTADGGRTWQSAATAMDREARGLVSGLQNGQQYNFRVRALNAVGQSDPSNESGWVTPAPASVVGEVSNVSLVPGGDSTSVLVSWIAPEPGTYAIAGYRLSWTNGSTDRGTVDFDISNRSYTVTGLTPGRSYIFSMYVRDVEGNIGSEVRTPITMPGGSGGEKDEESGGGGGGGGDAPDTTPLDTNATTSGSEAHISWTTRSEVGSYVAYGLDPDRLAYAVSDDATTTSHALTIDVSGIPSCTTLFYKIFETKSDFDARSERSIGMRGIEKVLIGTCRASVVDVSTSPLASSSRSSVVYGTARTPSGDKTGTYFEVAAPEAYSSRVSTEAVFQLKQLQRTEFLAAVAVPERAVLVSDVLDAKAYPDTTETISSFDKPLDISMNYLPELVDGLPLSSLSIWRQDDGVWTKLSGCSVDESTEVITCQTSHFSIFSVFAEENAPASGGVSQVPSGSLSGGCSIDATCTDMQAGDLVVGPVTQAPLVSDTGSLVTGSLVRAFKERVLMLGARGDHVALLQLLLVRLDPSEHLTLDGVFGPQTMGALTRFQLRYGLVTDGIFSAETRKKLIELVSSLYR
jgi:peptidoglycan hydrolase-like protein with peptidoglycan-binding domain